MISASTRELGALGTSRHQADTGCRGEAGQNHERGGEDRTVTVRSWESKPAIPCDEIGVDIRANARPTPVREYESAIRTGKLWPKSAQPVSADLKALTYDVQGRVKCLRPNLGRLVPRHHIAARSRRPNTRARSIRDVHNVAPERSPAAT